MESDGYDLKWKNHSNEVFGIVRKLRVKESFSDVLLHCGGKHFRAHKVILAACSTFFERMLSGMPPDKTRNPILVMTETKVELLELIIEFMYNGEVFIESAILEEFMNVAEKLEIRGLRKVNGNNAQSAATPSLAAPVGSGRAAAVRRREPESRSPTPPPAVMKMEEPEVSAPPAAKRPRPGGDSVARKVMPGLPPGITIEPTVSASDPIATTISSRSSRPSRPSSSDSSRSGLSVTTTVRKVSFSANLYF
jgi:hypothetical protein